MCTKTIVVGLKQGITMVVRYIALPCRTETQSRQHPPQYGSRTGRGCWVLCVGCTWWAGRQLLAWSRKTSLRFPLNSRGIIMCFFPKRDCTIHPLHCLHINFIHCMKHIRNWFEDQSSDKLSETDRTSTSDSKLVNLKKKANLICSPEWILASEPCSSCSARRSGELRGSPTWSPILEYWQIWVRNPGRRLFSSPAALASRIRTLLTTIRDRFSEIWISKQ